MARKRAKKTGARKGRVVVVTGGTGKLGRVVVPMLVQKGYKLRLVVRHSQKAFEFFPEYIERGKIELVESDLADTSSKNIALLAISCKGAFAVVNLAGLVELTASREVLYRANVLPTKSIIEAATRARVSRFVHISSTGVYGTPKELPATEKSDLRPVYAYGESKLQSEHLVAESVLPYVILRPSVIYGPSLVAQFEPAMKPLRKGMAVLLGNGENVLPFVHERDVARAIVLALHKNVLGQDFIICDDKTPLTQKQAYDIVARELGVKPPHHRLSITSAKILASIYGLFSGLVGKTPFISPEFIEVIGADRAFSSAKAHKLLGWQPKEKVRKALPQMVRFWKLHNPA